MRWIKKADEDIKVGDRVIIEEGVYKIVGCSTQDGPSYRGTTITINDEVIGTVVEAHPDLNSVNVELDDAYHGEMFEVYYSSLTKVASLKKKADEVSAPKNDLATLMAEIDFTPLEAKISELLGVSITFITKEAKGSSRINIETDNIVDQAGLFAAVFSDVRVENFGGEITSSGKKIWFPIHLAWKHIGGGTNGTDLVTALYTIETEEWEFRELQ
jgi:hypothetical protein